MILIKTNFLHEKSEGAGVSWGQQPLVVQEVSGETGQEGGAEQLLGQQVRTRALAESPCSSAQRIRLKH